MVDERKRRGAGVGARASASMLGSVAVHGALLGLLLLVPVGLRLATAEPASAGLTVRLAREAPRAAPAQPHEPALDAPSDERELPVPPPPEPADPPPAPEVPDLRAPSPLVDPAWARKPARPVPVPDPPAAAPPSTPAPPVAAAVVEATVAAQVLERIEPRYPPRCLRRGHAGTAVVRVTVGEDGLPRSPALARSAGCEELDAAALEAIARFRFAPATRGGVPLATVEEIAFIFQPQ